MSKAEKNRDENYLSEIMADDLMFRRAKGDIAFKQDYLNGVRDQNNTYSQLDFS